MVLPILPLWITQTTLPLNSARDYLLAVLPTGICLLKMNLRFVTITLSLEQIVTTLLQGPTLTLFLPVEVTILLVILLKQVFLISKMGGRKPLLQCTTGLLQSFLPHLLGRRPSVTAVRSTTLKAIQAMSEPSGDCSFNYLFSWHN